jgi:hypothetical protein
MRAQTVAPTERALVDKYCRGCHDERQRMGGVVLTTLDPAHVDRDAATWEAVVRRLRDETMPPPGLPRPEAVDTRAFVSAIETGLDRAFELAPNAGRPVLHRLNRVEYVNAIRDLLALEVEPDAILPRDASLEGFDNIGGALSMSPALMERYLSSARRISRLAVGDLSIGPAFASNTYEAPRDVWQNGRLDEELPFGSRGGLAIRHRFPLDGEYVCQIRLRRNILGYIRGLGEAHEIDMRVDGRRIARFTVGGESRGDPAPHSFSGVIRGDPRWEAYALSADDRLQVRFEAKAGTRTVGVAFAEELYEEEGVEQPPLSGLGFSYDESSTSPTGPWGPAVESVAIDGPYAASGPGGTPSRARIFLCRPAASEPGEACARTILSSVATRAYRRPVAEPELQTLLSFFRGGVSRSGFDEGIRAALERVLVDPNFLFRVERSPAPTGSSTVARISDLELASRLSFFLWSSIPDDELRALAAAGTLREPRVLASQVSRLRADARASALVDNFAVEWLSLRRLREVAPDPERFVDFDGNLRLAFERETKLFIASQLQEDHSLLDLITADYSFLNDRLAHHYGVSNVYGSHFRRVGLGDRAREGILGHGSILTLTSYPTRTSPVLRGRWLLDTLFGAPPLPPPADIPAFPPSIGSGGAVRTVRERTEQHRTNPACAGCHQRMDPLGFLLENFDAIGRWRATDESGASIDASGSFPDGARRSGSEGLRALVLEHSEDFARAVTAKLLTYALGRTLEPYDAPAVRRIVRDAAPGRYRWSSIIDGVVMSVPFQMRNAEP